MPQEETRALIEEMAEALVADGVPRTEVAAVLVKNLPYNEDYARSLIPEVYKNPVRAEIGRKGAEFAELSRQNKAEQTVKTQDSALEQASLHKTVPKAFDAAAVKTCERCGVQTTEPKTWHGHTLCSRCKEKAEFNPEAYDGYFKYQERGKAGLIPKAKPVAHVAESWEHRKEVMSQPVSKMDVEMLKLVQGSSEIRELGYKVEFQKEYLTMVCRSDLSLVRNGSEVMCFWDGSDVHKDPERDGEKRERAKQEQQRHGTPTEILSEPYKAYSDGERNRLFGVVLERLREMEKWREPKSIKGAV